MNSIVTVTNGRVANEAKNLEQEASGENVEAVEGQQ